MAKRFTNKNPYTVTVMDINGTTIYLKPGDILEGDWFERFVGPKSITYFSEGAPAIKRDEEHPDMRAVRFMDKTKAEWIGYVRSMSMEDMASKFSKGQLIGISEFTGIPITDSKREDMIRQLKDGIR